MFRKLSILMFLSLMITSVATAQDVNETEQPAEELYFDELLAPLPCYLAQADEENSSKTGPGNRFGRAKRRYMEAMNKQRQHLEQFRLLKLFELLDLDEDNEIAFLTKFRGMRKELGEVQGQRKELIEELAGSLKEEQVDREQVDRAIKNLSELEREKNKIIEHFIQEAHEFLDAEQLAKFIIFQERFEFELLERLKNFQGRKEREKP